MNMQDFTKAATKVNEGLERLGLYYNLLEVLGHMTAYKDENIKHVAALEGDDLDANIENACNVIDLNNEDDD